MDLALWQPLIEDRAFVPWLVRQPGPAEVARARHLTLAQAGQLEDAWRANPAASLADLAPPGAQDAPAPVALRRAPAPRAPQPPNAPHRSLSVALHERDQALLGLTAQARSDGRRQGERALRARRYEDAYAYQNVFGPLVALEAAHDRAMKEAQVRAPARCAGAPCSIAAPARFTGPPGAVVCQPGRTGALRAAVSADERQCGGRIPANGAGARAGRGRRGAQVRHSGGRRMPRRRGTT